ncbi:imelysin family protein [Tenacibaculum amylolyticum]|uniref:imelysin family protein n=1 Tax=Tenacibaculum amylolyticum TaxID=104269 RepID=UPI0038962CAB
MRKIIVMLTVIAIVFACSNDSESRSEATFDVAKLRSEFISEIETPATTAFVNSVTDLNTAIVAFYNTTSQTNLESLRTQWKQTAKAFAFIEIMDFGEIQSSLIMSSFYTWGANETAINDYIASTNPITETTINARSTNTRGLSAIEFLLFENAITETLNDFSNTRRKEYLKVLGENLVKKAQILNSAWASYRSTFINNSSTGINGSVNMLVNQINVLLENVKRFKIGEPAGFQSTSTINTIALQAEKSEFSLNLIKENIAAVKSIYFGTANSLDNYVSAVTNSNEINDKILGVINAIEGDIATLENTSLSNAITFNISGVTKLYESINVLIVLVKVDVASALSVTITFTDNDGD